MPKVGHRIVENQSRSTRYLPILEELKEVSEAILSESGIGVDSLDVYRNDAACGAMKQWFCENSIDESAHSIEEVDDHLEMMGELYENNKATAVNEATSVSSVNPTIGFQLLMHKNLLMNSAYKQGVPTSVAVSPKFTETFKREYLVKPDGTRLDIALEQEKLTDAMLETVPSVEIELSLPEYAVTDIMAKLEGTKIDKLAVDSYISKVKVEVSDEYIAAHPEEKTPSKDGEPALIFEEREKNPGEEEGTGVSKWYKWIDVKYDFVPAAYVKDFDRSVTAKVELDGIVKPIKINESNVTSDIINANLKVSGEQKVYITSATGLIKGVKLNTKVDASLGTIETCSTDYETEDTIFEIPAGVPLNTTITPDIVKDIKALYNLSHISVVMEQTMKVLDNFKDDSIRKYLDSSYNRLNDKYKVAGNFDFVPRQDYALDVVEYRKKSFMDLFESYGTKLLNILNDPDVSFSIFGRTDIVRRLTPTEYTYQSPGTLGNVPLDFTKTIYTSNRRNYNFISSRKIKDDDLTIILNPNNGNNRKIYNLYEYCFYMGNEIRNNQNLAIPSLHAYERFLMTEYQPVQGRIEILNPTGYKNEAYKGL